MHLIRVQWPNNNICGQSFSSAPRIFISSGPSFAFSSSSINLCSPNLSDADRDLDALKHSEILSACTAEILVCILVIGWFSIFGRFSWRLFRSARDALFWFPCWCCEAAAAAGAAMLLSA